MVLRGLRLTQEATHKAWETVRGGQREQEAQEGGRHSCSVEETPRGTQTIAVKDEEDLTQGCGVEDTDEGRQGRRLQKLVSGGRARGGRHTARQG